MKKIRYILLMICIPLFAISSYSMSLAYNNDKTLFYDGKSKEFKYYNTANQVLFDDFQDLMPGDEKIDEFTISAKNIAKDSKLYLDIKNNNVLDYLNISIFKDDEEIFNSVNESEKKVLLHTFTKDEDVDLKFVVGVSTEIGNEVDDATFSFDLNFLMEDNEDVLIPATYDSGRIILNSSILIISLIGIALVIVNKRNERFIEK